jgi:hypothetical protein
MQLCSGLSIFIPTNVSVHRVGTADYQFQKRPQARLRWNTLLSAVKGKSVRSDFAVLPETSFHGIYGLWQFVMNSISI